jgi:hypothetical protein
MDMAENAAVNVAPCAVSVDMAVPGGSVEGTGVAPEACAGPAAAAPAAALSAGGMGDPNANMGAAGLPNAVVPLPCPSVAEVVPAAAAGAAVERCCMRDVLGVAPLRVPALRPAAFAPGLL